MKEGTSTVCDSSRISKRNSPDAINVLRVSAIMFVFLNHGRSFITGIESAGNHLSFLAETPAWAGVWILVFLSGYLMAKGFFNNKYRIFNTGNSPYSEILKFYYGRLIRIAPIYYIYVLLFEVFRSDTYLWTNPKIALELLTFTFNGNGGISGIGHLWYLSLAMQLYLIAPFAYILIGKIKRTRLYFACFIIIALAGATLRLLLMKTGADWYKYVYTFSPVNLDLFICGMIADAIVENIRKNPPDRFPGSGIKLLTVLTFIALVVYNCYISFYSSTLSVKIYSYYLPTLYILACAAILLAFDCNPYIIREKASRNTICRNPLRLIDWFAPITFVFYVLHIAVFSYADVILQLFSSYGTCYLKLKYLWFFGTSFVITLIAAYPLTKMSEVFGKHPTIKQK